jgi:glycosyltransferase involved in cell wall biosynthesis
LGFLRAKAVIAQTDFVKQSILKRLPSIKNKVHRVYSGVPKVFEIQHSNWRIPIEIEKEFKILYIAHPAEYKNFDILFETSKLAKEKNIRFIFLLTLDRTPDNPRYLNFVSQYLAIIQEYEIEEYVYFIGSLKNSAEIKEAYLFTDAVIHPSLVESFPQTFTEAMQFGKPLISIDLPYAKEIAGEASLYFENDPYGLLESIMKYMNDKELFLDMSTRSRERVAFFDPMKRWTELYNLIKSVKT